MVTSGSKRPNRLCGQYLRIHVAYYIGIGACLVAIDLTFSETRWFHWPLMIWGGIFCAHLLYCKSLSVDDEWVEKRTNRIRDHSYDLGHIRNIEDSYKEKTPPEESGEDERK
tara:strand:- start:307 stop:642 length:336 start_codon:yes stop_codon:yes gene_type:complete